jgi:ubiquitin carboxyl-terminal hydrolase L5
VYGLIFLSRWVAPETTNEVTEVPDGVWFANQTMTNSCATVALLNIINNHKCIDFGMPLDEFRERTSKMTPKDRGLAIDRFDHVRNVHNSFATELDKMCVDMRLKEDFAAYERKKRRTASKKRTRKKARNADYEDESGLHFVAFVPVDGVVWRMDGLERCPRKVGMLSEGDSWVAAVLPELQSQLESAVANDLEYSLLSLTSTVDVARVEADVAKTTRTREDWGPFLSTLVRIHAEKGTLRDAMK